MSASKRFSAILSLFIFCISACKAGTPPPTPVTLLDAAQGGQISYGTVHGAATQAQAMSKILNNIQNTCGESPQIGRVFQFKGTPTVGVFFTVTDHTKGNKKLAGMVLSAPSGPRQVDAAMLSNDAARIGKSVNPMLQQLFSVWHPDSQSAASGSSAGAQSAPAGNWYSASAARLHMVTAPDNSATMGIADGWQLDPHSASSTMILNGPNGEQVVWGAVGQAVDPYHPQQTVAVRYGIYKGTTTILYPYQQDLVRAYPDLLQAWRRALNQPPVKLQVESIEPDQVDPKLGKCVVVKGHIDADGQGMKKLIDNFCITPLTQWGAYTIHRVYNIMTDDQSEREQNTVAAMMQTVKVNQQVMAQQTQQLLAQKQQSDQQWRDWGQQQSDRIRAQSQAMQKSNADRQAGYDRQNAAYWDRQHSNAVQYSNSDDGMDTRARNNQSFSNYILDQTVVQDNNMDGNGTIGHGTVWNSTADALVKADPNRFEYVTQPNFWQGTDYRQ